MLIWPSVKNEFDILVLMHLTFQFFKLRLAQQQHLMVVKADDRNTFTRVRVDECKSCDRVIVGASALCRGLSAGLRAAFEGGILHNHVQSRCSDCGELLRAASAATHRRGDTSAESQVAATRSWRLCE